MQNTAFNGDSDSGEVEKSDHEIQIDMRRGDKKMPAMEPYAGMNKEDLLRFSQTPFWNRLRMTCLMLFWFAWLGLLAAVVVLTIVLPRCSEAPSESWWQKSVFYQVYLRSYQDSDDNGSGDLKGLESRLDYIKSLNSDSVILSSVLDSGSAGDIGYQVIDYRAIDALFGDMTDFTELLEAAHTKDMKVIIDFVPNHTGKNHSWFAESAKSSDPSNPYWNYYVWADCMSGTAPPNNWRTIYNQEAWTYDTTRDQCYLHQFLSDQPELNLRSDAVKEELMDCLKFWLDKGVDGVRINSVAYLYEDGDLRNDTYNDTLCESKDVVDYSCYQHENTRDLDLVHNFVANIKDVMNQYNDRVLITDAITSNEETVHYYSKLGAYGADLPLYYGLRSLTPTMNGQDAINIIHPWVDSVSLRGTTDWLVDYQDVNRTASLYGEEYSRILTMLSMTLPGVPITYYGQELGMLDGQHGGVDPAGFYGFSRDAYRSPMQWTSGTNAGFTNSSNPYLPVNNATVISVQNEESDQDSALNIFRKLALLHVDSTAFQYGSTHFQNSNIPVETIAFIREYDGTDRYLIIINMSDKEVSGDFKQTYGTDFSVADEATVAFTTNSADVAYQIGATVSTSSITIPPYQGIILMWEFSR